MVGCSSFMDENPWNEQVLTKEDMQKYVESEGRVMFRIHYKGEDKEKQGCKQKWTEILTMKSLDEEENELKMQFQQQAQEEANRTGKKAVVTNLVGWKFEAEPEK